MNASTIPREEARRLNGAIDRSLLHSTELEIQAVLKFASVRGVSRIAERVRRRATLLGRAESESRRGIIQARDRLIQTLYGHSTPPDRYVAWCDGSVRGSRAGIGGLILASRNRRLVKEISEPADPGDAMSVELAAVTAVIRAALERGAERLRVYTDCDALVGLWLRKREDPRLAELRGAAEGLRHFELCSIPRQHNQPAHQLARSALA